MDSNAYINTDNNIFSTNEQFTDEVALKLRDNYL